jgi:hypothetical protein
MIEQKTEVIEPKQDLEVYQALLEVAQQERRIKTNQAYTHAYVVSFLFPPSGIYYFFKYLFFANGTSEDVKAGVISLALTIGVIILSVWSFAALFQQLSPGGSSQSLDQLKNTTSPENMKELIKLYQ